MITSNCIVWNSKKSKTPSCGDKKICTPRGIHAKRKLLAHLSPNNQKDITVTVCPDEDTTAFMSEIENLSYEKARQIVEDAFENHPPKCSRGLNVEAATAHLHALEEDGDAFNIKGFAYEDEIECESQPLNETIVGDEVKVSP